MILCIFVLLLSPQIAALAAQNATTQDIEILVFWCDEIETLIHEGQDFMQKDMDFHAILAICSRNTVMSNSAPLMCQIYYGIFHDGEALI